MAKKGDDRIYCSKCGYLRSPAHTKAHTRKTVKSKRLKVSSIVHVKAHTRKRPPRKSFSLF